MSEPRPGMGAIVHESGVAFRVWAPHARQVSVIGSFNGWADDKHPMRAEKNGTWYLDVAEAGFGDGAVEVGQGLAEDDERGQVAREERQR